MATLSPWRNRIIGSGVEAPDQLVANPRNWRTHPNAQRDALRGSLIEIGWVQQVLVNRQTGHVVDGHARVEEALSRGELEVPVLYVDLDEDEEAMVLATLDPIGAMAAQDSQKLDELLSELHSDDAGIQALLDSMGTDEPKEGLTDPDDVPELGEETHIKRGDLFALGDHRLMCGDSTKAEDVARLMDGRKADVILTDPPYGIGATTMTLGTGKKDFHRGHWDEQRPDVSGLATSAPQVIVWGGNYFTDQLPPTNDWLCWHKKNDGLTFSEFELAWTNLGRNCRILAHNWSGEEKAHPTQKPVRVIQWCVEMTTGDIYDPFSGSGTTIIAAEQLGRRCYAMEIDPRYVAVAIKRWEDFTGKVSERIDG